MRSVAIIGFILLSCTLAVSQGEKTEDQPAVIKEERKGESPARADRVTEEGEQKKISASIDRVILMDETVRKGKISEETENGVVIVPEGIDDSYTILNENIHRIEYSDGRTKIVNSLEKPDIMNLMDGGVLRVRVLHIKNEVVLYRELTGKEEVRIERNRVKSIVLADGRTIELEGRDSTRNKKKTIQKKEGDSTAEEKKTGGGKKKTKKLEFSFGALGSHNWWQPTWLTFNDGPETTYRLSSEVLDPYFAYGGYLEFVINRNFFVSLDMTYARAETEVEQVTSFFLLSYYNSFTRKFRKFDPRLRFGPIFLEMIRLCFGFQYDGYSYKDRGYSYYLDPLGFSSIVFPMQGGGGYHRFGPELGIGFDYEFPWGLFLEAYGTGVFLLGVETTTVFSPTGDNKNTELNHFGFGLDSSIMAGYRIPKVNMRVGLGFQYKLLSYDVGGNPSYLRGLDHRYGITAKVGVTF